MMHFLTLPPGQNIPAHHQVIIILGGGQALTIRELVLAW
jgi:hypothetical protein